MGKNIQSIHFWTVAIVLMGHLCICEDKEHISNNTTDINNVTSTQTSFDTNNEIFRNNEDSIEIEEGKFKFKRRKRPILNENATFTNDLELALINKTEMLIKIDNTTETNKIGNEDENFLSNSYEIENITEPCVGDPEYCGMSEVDYTAMLMDYLTPQPYEWGMIVVNAVVFVIGLIGNALVCAAVYRNHSMRTVTNYFIVNLAVADFLVILVCLPPTVLWDVTETWFFGDALCRIVLYVQSVSVTVSVLTLTFISLDRWYAICFPLKFKSTTGRAKTAIVIIWFLSLGFNLPEVVVLQVQMKTPLRFNLQYFMQCMPTWSQQSDLTWHIIKAIFLYTLPLCLMSVAYCQIIRVLWRSDNIPGHSESNNKLSIGQNNVNRSSANRRTVPSIHANASTEGQLRSRRKAAKMLVAVVLMFAFCYFPVHLISVLRIATDIQQTDGMTAVALISHAMCYANSAVNPLIYNFMSGFPGFSGQSVYEVTASYCVSFVVQLVVKFDLRIVMSFFVYFDYIIKIIIGKFRREFHRAYHKCFCCCRKSLTPDRNGTSFAPLGSSRTGTTRTIVRRNDSCVSYKLTHLSPSNQNSINRDFVRTANTSFIEQPNGSRLVRVRDDSPNESVKFTLTADISKD